MKFFSRIAIRKISIDSVIMVAVMIAIPFIQETSGEYLKYIKPFIEQSSMEDVQGLPLPPSKVTVMPVYAKQARLLVLREKQEPQVHYFYHHFQSNLKPQDYHHHHPIKPSFQNDREIDDHSKGTYQQEHNDEQSSEEHLHKNGHSSNDDDNDESHNHSEKYQVNDRGSAKHQTVGHDIDSQRNRTGYIDENKGSYKTSQHTQYDDEDESDAHKHHNDHQIEKERQKRGRYINEEGDRRSREKDALGKGHQGIQFIRSQPEKTRSRNQRHQSTRNQRQQHHNAKYHHDESSEEQNGDQRLMRVKKQHGDDSNNEHMTGQRHQQHKQHDHAYDDNDEEKKHKLSQINSKDHHRDHHNRNGNNAHAERKPSHTTWYPKTPLFDHDEFSHVYDDEFDEVDMSVRVGPVFKVAGNADVKLGSTIRIPPRMRFYPYFRTMTQWLPVEYEDYE